MERALPKRAIDHAFITHTIGLFERFNADIKVQTADKRGLEHCRKQFIESFTYARTTHAEMIKHLDSIRDEDL